jgi:hypothetical protein
MGPDEISPPCSRMSLNHLLLECLSIEAHGHAPFSMHAQRSHVARDAALSCSLRRSAPQNAPPCRPPTATSSSRAESPSSRSSSSRCSSSPAVAVEQRLTGTQWQLASIRQTTPAYQGVVPAADQPRYTITFNTTGPTTGRRTATRSPARTPRAARMASRSRPGPPPWRCAPRIRSALVRHALTTATTWSVASSQLTLSRADGAR